MYIRLKRYYFILSSYVPSKKIITDFAETCHIARHAISPRKNQFA